jgi:hypothetical protein
MDPLQVLEAALSVKKVQKNILKLLDYPERRAIQTSNRLDHPLCAQTIFTR